MIIGSDERSVANTNQIVWKVAEDASRGTKNNLSTFMMKDIG
jgi:hypothetical protein